MSSPSRSDDLSTEDLAQLVDGAVGDRVLVHGSLPGHGRDIDLLARPPEVVAIDARLSGEGFTRVGRNFARFREGSVELLECIPTSEWDLPEGEISALFGSAISIGGYQHLVRPSGCHMLLILARRIVEGSGRLDDKRRSYVDRALGDDPEAWDHAFDSARAWRAELALPLLLRLYSGGRVTKLAQAKVVQARLRATGRGPLRAKREAFRQLGPPLSRGAVIGLTGTDLGELSMQSGLLAGVLDRVGFPTVVMWIDPPDLPAATDPRALRSARSFSRFEQVVRTVAHLCSGRVIVQVFRFERRRAVRPLRAFHLDSLVDRATSSPQELAARIARDVWVALEDRQPRLRSLRAVVGRRILDRGATGQDSADLPE